MTTKYAIIATTAILVLGLIFVAVACSGIISSGKSQAEVSRRASQLGMGSGILLGICLAPIWIWWAHSRRAARLKDDDEDRPRRKRRRSDDDEDDDPRPRKRRRPD